MWVLSLVLLLASPSFQLPARVLKQRVPKFKNFPVVGIKENHSAEADIEQEALVEHPRDARNADAQWNNHDDTDSAAAGQYDVEHLDDTFVEEAIFLTPEAREARALEEEGEEVQVQYHADETGFHATGSHVPQAPPMPPHVQRLLDHLAKVNGLERL